MLDIKWMDIDGIEHYSDNRKHVVISITSPGSREARLPRSPSRRDTLRVQFWDIKVPLCQACDTAAIACVDKDKHKLILEPMTAQTACAIADFVNKWHNLVELIIVHCGMGISRSVGVACAISDFLGRKDERFALNAGNGHVRTLVYNALTNGANTPEGADSAK